MKKYSILLLSILLASTYSCTDLDVVPSGDISENNFFKNPDQVYAAVNRVYTQSYSNFGISGGRHWRVSELTSDHFIWPQKGRHGYDGGDWGRMHYHSWTTSTSEGINSGSWNGLFTGVGYCNTYLDALTPLDFTAIGMTDAEKKTIIAQLKVVRAWQYIGLIDLYGNVPIVTQVGVPLSPPTASRSEVFDFAEKEILDNINDLPLLSKSTQGYMTKAGAYALLADMYLNSQAWIGKERWDDCINYCNKIINGEGGSATGTMALDVNITDAFSNTNITTSKEGVLMSALNVGSGFWMARSDPGAYKERDIMGTRHNGNNGVVSTPNAYATYKEKDLRRFAWFMYGIGKGYGGYNMQGPYKDIGRKTDDFVLGTEEFMDRPIIYCYKPIKSVVEVSGTPSTPLAQRRITIKEWYSPEFPGDEAKLLMEEAYNSMTLSNKTKSLIVTNYDAGNAEVYNSGAYNGQMTDPQYPWSTKNDYRFMWQDCAENTGARIYKYHLGLDGTAAYANNAWHHYRLTYLYFAKAEALMRKNGGVATQEIVDLINASKKRAFLPEYWDSAEAEANADRYTTATFTMDEFVDEWAREFMAEGKRRMVLIRFGKYEFGLEGWWDANAGYPDGSVGTLDRSQHRRLLAIPQTAIVNNPNLAQNPGYGGI